MTIDSSWILSFKEEAAEAFSDKSPFRPKAVFCDGQIRLMRGHQDEFITWDEYIFHQFHATYCECVSVHRPQSYSMRVLSSVLIMRPPYWSLWMRRRRVRCRVSMLPAGQALLIFRAGWVAWGNAGKL
jgi:hypothetical protein